MTARLASAGADQGGRDVRADLARGADRAQDAAADAASSKPVSALARLGLAARGTIYLLLGVFALLLAFDRAAPEADQRGAMQEASRHAGGFVLLIVLAAGFAGYALWRLIEAAFGTAEHGTDAWPRAKSLGRAVIYASLAYSALDILISGRRSSQADQQQMWSARLMSHAGGRWLVGIAGVVLAAVGVGLAIGGLRRTFAKHFAMGQMPPGARRIVLGVGAVGVTARGLVFALVGAFLLLAAWRYDPSSARGLDGALRRLEATSGGAIWVAAAGLGLIAFGLYGYAEAAWRRTETAADRS